MNKMVVDRLSFFIIALFNPDGVKELEGPDRLDRRIFLLLHIPIVGWNGGGRHLTFLYEMIHYESFI